MQKRPRYRKNIGPMITMMVHGMPMITVNAWTDLPGQPTGYTAHEEEQTVSDEETAVALNALEACDFENFPDATAQAVQLQCAAERQEIARWYREEGISCGKKQSFL